MIDMIINISHAILPNLKLYEINIDIMLIHMTIIHMYARNIFKLNKISLANTYSISSQKI